MFWSDPCVIVEADIAATCGMEDQHWYNGNVAGVYIGLEE